MNYNYKNTRNQNRHFTPKNSKNKQQHKGKLSKLLRKFKIVSLILLLAITGLFLYLYFNYTRAINTTNFESDEPVSFVIKHGESPATVTQNLVDAKILQSSYQQYFLLYLRLNNLNSKIQAGTYSIPQNLTIPEIAETIQLGGIQEVWIQIPEGITKKQIAKLLEKKLTETSNSSFTAAKFVELTIDKNFIDSLEINLDLDDQDNSIPDEQKGGEITDTTTNITDLEGFLFPDKYLVPIDINEGEFITLLVDTFKSKTSELDVDYNDLIIASMIEREGSDLADRKVISGIIRKRWKEGWFLGIDATILYYKEDWSYKITKQDIKQEHPYNTYTTLGIPPGPICNPGLTAIIASINPTDSDFYYYIHDKDGKPHYAVTLSEHNANIRKYLK